MVPPLEENEDGDRVSFPRWGKRNVVSHHFTELIKNYRNMIDDSNSLTILLFLTIF